MIKQLIVIQGPTASGKTDLAVLIAAHFNASIISADSRQFFKEMSIGTAKPTLEEQKGITHFFIDSHSISDEVSSARFAREASDCLNKLFESNDMVVLVGGSGMFVDALCNGLDEIPRSIEIRNELSASWENGKTEALLDELKKADPLFYETVDKNNPVRIIRALEAIRLTNKPFSELRTNNIKTRSYQLNRFIIDIDREHLYSRINMRVDIMIERGLKQEVENLQIHRNQNAMRTVGYSELLDYFDGKITFENAVELIKQNSRRYAKRQLTWLRRYEDATWIPFDSAENMLKTVLKSLKET